MSEWFAYQIIRYISVFSESFGNYPIKIWLPKELYNRFINECEASLRVYDGTAHRPTISGIPVVVSDSLKENEVLLYGTGYIHQLYHIKDDKPQALGCSDKKCSCEIRILMMSGCKCGGS